MNITHITFAFIATVFINSTINATPEPNNHQANTQERLAANNITEPVELIVNNMKSYSSCECYKLFGTKLKDCMTSLEKKDLLNNLKKLNPRAARNYLISLRINEYREVLQNISAQEWQEYYQNLDQEYKDQFPRTKDEQLEAIEESEKLTYKTTSSTTVNTITTVISSTVSLITGYWFIALPRVEYTTVKESISSEEKFEKLKKEMFRL